MTISAMDQTMMYERIRERAQERVRSYANQKRIQERIKAKVCRSKQFCFEKKRLPVNFFDSESMKFWEEGMENAKAKNDTSTYDVYKQCLQKHRDHGYPITGDDLIKCLWKVRSWNTFAESVMTQYEEWGSISDGQLNACIKMFQKLAKKRVEEKGEPVLGEKVDSEKMPYIKKDHTAYFNIFYDVRPTDHSDYNNDLAKRISEKNSHISDKTITKIFGEEWKRAS